MWRLLLLLLCLTACVPQSGSLVSPETGISGQYSPQVIVFRNHQYTILAHVLLTERDGEHLRTLVLSQRRDGVNPLRFEEVWSNGIQLPFARAGALDGCSHGHCRNRHAGFVFLSAPLFAHVQTHGLEARLLSGTTNLDISVPASLFHLPAP